MSGFNVCIRVALSATGPKPSHAWMAQHRCVEALARLTGEPFTEIMHRLGRTHGFSRARSSWPSAERIRDAAAQLQEERSAWLDTYDRLAAESRERKRRGDRRGVAALEQMEAARQVHNSLQPRVGYWGWREIRHGGFCNPAQRATGCFRLRASGSTMPRRTPLGDTLSLHRPAHAFCHKDTTC